MGFLSSIWNFFATYILRQAPYMIGFITLIGYALMKKKWYDILGGTLKAIIGMLILNVGSGGLVSNFRPILAGLKDRFNLDACVIDPYYGQNAVTAGVEEVFGKGFSQVMTLLLIAFIVNYAAYFAEIYRGGIESISIGQYEAAEVLGYTKVQTFMRIILPQVVKRIMPSVTNEVVTLVKDTSMAFTVSYQEMFTIGKQIANSQTSFMPFVVAGVFYYLFNAIVDYLMGRIEKRLDYYR